MCSIIFYEQTFIDAVYRIGRIIHVVKLLSTVVCSDIKISLLLKRLFSVVALNTRDFHTSQRPRILSVTEARKLASLH